MRRSSWLSVCGWIGLCVALTWGQAGRRLDVPRDGGGLLLNVTAKRDDNKTDAVTFNQVSIYDAGVQQTIKTFTVDPGPAHIVLLVDNSTTLRLEEEKLMQTAREFAYEIYEGDKLMVVSYTEEAEILADWTDSAKQIEAATKQFHKKGEPQLFDALHAVLADALDPLAGSTKKRVIVIIGDGLDRGSKTKFDSILAELQNEDITVYALQVPDRTGGAYKRDKPKPPAVLEKLTAGTGGLILPATNPSAAAKSICDELRNNRYILAYQPSSIPYGEARALLVAADDGITVRAKSTQPAK